MKLTPELGILDRGELRGTIAEAIIANIRYLLAD